jgi:hypothetical protein
MTKGKRQKNRQHNDQRKKTEGQTTQWPKEKDRRTDNTMAKGKRQKNRQHNDQRKKTEGQPTQWPLWPLCCLFFCLFPLAIVLSVLLFFSFGHCVVCSSVFFLWPLCCLFFCLFPLVIVLSVLLSFSFGHCVVCSSVFFQKNRQHNGQRKKTEEQTTQ